VFEGSKVFFKECDVTLDLGEDTGTLLKITVKLEECNAFWS